MKDLTLKELRKEAGLTQKEMYEEFGVPLRSIQNWETGVRECPEYVEDMLKEALIKYILVAQIRYEKEFGKDKLSGFSCYLKDRKSEEYNFSWFIPSKEGLISEEIVWKIGQLSEAGWKIHFIN